MEGLRLRLSLTRGVARLVEVLLYVRRNRRFIWDGKPGRPPRLSHTAPDLCLWPRLERLGLGLSVYSIGLQVGLFLLLSV